MVIEPGYNSLLKWLRVIALVAAFGAVGYLTGWLVGGSETPVVAAVLPLVFGLLAGVGAGYMEALSKLRDVRGLIESHSVPNREQLMKAVGGHNVSFSGLGSIAVIVFCLACYVGVKTGIELRIPTYPSVMTVLGPEAQPTFEEVAEIHRLRSFLHTRNVPTADFEEIVRYVVLPLLSDPQYGPGGDLADFRRIQLAQLIDKVIEPDASRGPGRGPASPPE